jgi:hypothetical protein
MLEPMRLERASQRFAYTVKAGKKNASTMSKGRIINPAFCNAYNVLLKPG